MKKCLLLLFILSICILPSTLAWTSYTHKWICDKIGLNDTDCAAADYPKVQSEHPDLSFKNHHCTADAYDCSARIVAAKYLTYSYPEAKGYAAHMYSDSMVPVHWYSTDYDTCHKIFEDAVEEKLRKVESIKYNLFKSSYDFSTWNVTMQCQAKFGKENKTIELYVDNKYMDMTADYVATQMHIQYQPATVKDYDLTPYIYILLMFMILVLVLFIYFGMKNKKK
jgi:hypothetical protein